jgi:protein MpaA
VNGTFDWPGFLTHFARAAAEAGFAEQVLAETAAGPLTVWERGETGPSIYVSAGMHGDEPAGPLALAEMVKSGLLPHDIRWALCPAANPTGLALGTRENGDGVDLNRDYLRRSSAEVQAHAAWLESRPAPDLFISLHEDWEARGFYFYEINLGPDVPNRAATILDAVRPWFEPDAGHEIDGHSPRAPGWIYHEAEADVPEGWPEAIFLAKLGCPLSFTFETPSHAALDQRVAAHLAAVRAVLDATGP